MQHNKGEVMAMTWPQSHIIIPVTHFQDCCVEVDCAVAF